MTRSLPRYRPAITTSGRVIGPRTPPMITSRVSRCLIFQRARFCVVHCRAEVLFGRCTTPRSAGKAWVPVRALRWCSIAGCLRRCTASAPACASWPGRAIGCQFRSVARLGPATMTPLPCRAHAGRPGTGSSWCCSAEPGCGEVRRQVFDAQTCTWRWIRGRWAAMFPASTYMSCAAKMHRMARSRSRHGPGWCR
jgi:hypothetical protein